MPIWSIWEDADGNPTLVDGDGTPRSATGIVIDPDARRVKVFEAETFGDAILRKNWYYGWEPALPMGDAVAPRDVDRLAAACREMLKAMESLATDGGDFYEESAARRDAEMLRAALAAIDKDTDGGS